MQYCNQYHIQQCVNLYCWNWHTAKVQHCAFSIIVMLLTTWLSIWLSCVCLWTMTGTCHSDGTDVSIHINASERWNKNDELVTGFCRYSIVWCSLPKLLNWFADVKDYLRNIPKRLRKTLTAPDGYVWTQWEFLLVWSA